MQSIVVDQVRFFFHWIMECMIICFQYRKELEEEPEETADIVEQLDSMVEQSIVKTSLDENVLTSIFTIGNKKYIDDPLQERRALVESMGQTLTLNEDTEQ